MTTSQLAYIYINIDTQAVIIKLSKETSLNKIINNEVRSITLLIHINEVSNVSTALSTKPPPTLVMKFPIFLARLGF